MSKRNVPDPKAGKITGKHDSLIDDVKATLVAIHKEMYDKALAERDARIVYVDKWEEKIKELTKAEAQDVEVAGGLKMGAKSLCIPHEEKYHVNCPPKCIISGLPVTKRVLFGRSY